MTHPARHYAEALYLALEGKKAAARTKILKQLLVVLEKNKQVNLVHQILTQYERIFLKRQGMRKVDIESASPLTDSVRKDIEKIVGGKIVLSEEVKPDLLAGLTILIDDSLYIDASGRSAVTNLF